MNLPKSPFLPNFGGINVDLLILEVSCFTIYRNLDEDTIFFTEEKAFKFIITPFLNYLNVYTSKKGKCCYILIGKTNIIILYTLSTFVPCFLQQDYFFILLLV